MLTSLIVQSGAEPRVTVQQVFVTARHGDHHPTDSIRHVTRDGVNLPAAHAQPLEQLRFHEVGGSSWKISARTCGSQSISTIRDTYGAGSQVETGPSAAP